MTEEKDLLALAISVSKLAYAPYSKFAVGRVVVSESDELYTGCNVENVSFGLTNCAERTAVFKGVSNEGDQFRIKKLIIFTPTEMPVSPCGACRQVLKEFGDDFEVISYCNGNESISMNIKELIPASPNINFKR